MKRLGIAKMHAAHWTSVFFYKLSLNAASLCSVPLRCEATTKDFFVRLSVFFYVIQMEHSDASNDAVVVATARC